MAKAKSGAVRAADDGNAGRQLVLGASKNGYQKRTGRASDWTDAMADDFIAVLADSCNVSLAARAINRSIGNIYKQRAIDAKFRAQWDQALAIGYAQLEMMMLERAVHGVEKTIVLRTGEVTVMRQYSDRVALSLLRMHRENVAAIDYGVDQEDYQEACERIIVRLERLRERDQEEENERTVETKQALGRLEWIRWGLRRHGRTVDADVR